MRISSSQGLMENNTCQQTYKGLTFSWTAEESIGGNKEALQALRELIIFPYLYISEAKQLGHKWPRGLLLYGPPGTGKTSLVQAVVRECGAHLTVISPHLVHRSHAGEGERFLREAFSEAISNLSSGKPSVVFVDEIDAICQHRDSRSEQDVRVTTQLMVLMDSISIPPTYGPQVVVVASTNRIEAIDPAFRRYGRFCTEVEVTAPCEEARHDILKLYTRNMKMHSDVNLRAIAASLNSYVGADLEALCREAVISAGRKSLNEESTDMVCLTIGDWDVARSIVRPSMTKGVTVEIPKVSWEDIGGLKDVKKQLQRAVEWPIKHSVAFSRLGITPVRGILLHGPPGCSKTTLAKATAHATQASFFSLSGADLYSMYVGEGETLLRNTFRRARLATPSIIFFDEADVVGAKRGGEGGNNHVGERLLSTLLTEMDGLEDAKGILVLAATNRPYSMDAALMRPGRFDLVIYVPPPDIESRYEILQVHTRNMKLGKDVNLRSVAEKTELLTGAELEGLCNEAAIFALREDISASVVDRRHFSTAIRSLRPRLTREDVDSYFSFMQTPYRKPTKTTPKSGFLLPNIIIFSAFLLPVFAAFLVLLERFYY